MSQAGVLDVESANPQIPTSFTTDSGTAVPLANDLEVIGGSGITTSGSGKTVTIDIDAPIGVSLGGTGRSTLTDGAVLIGDGTSVVELATLTNGQLLIGDTGSSPATAALSQGAGITIVNGAGTITISAGATVSTSFAADSGTATPALNVITLAGTSAQGITTSAAGSTVTFTISDASTSQKGTIETATDAEAVAVTATDKALVPLNMVALLAEPPAIGGTTPAVGTFTQVNADNTRLDGNTLSTTDTNGDLLLTPDGTGGVVATTSLTIGNTSKDVSFTINGAAIAGTVSAEGLDAAALGGIISHRHSSTAGFGGHFIGLRSRGTHASPTVVQDNDVIGLFAFAGYDGTDYAQAAQVSIEVDGTPGSDDMPSRMVFLTSADGAQAPAEAMRISSEQKVGINNPTLMDEFNINGAMDIQHTSTEADDHALEIDVNAAGFGDVKAIDIAYITGTLSGTDEEAVILVNIDETSATGGTIVGYEMLSTTEGTDTPIGVKTSIGIDVIHQETGTFGDADEILNKAVDVTAALANGGAGNISIFVADDDTITIGDAAIWDETEVILDTAASGSGVAPTFQYSTGGAGYSSFTPVDGTNGFRNSGIIDWVSGDLTGWATATSGRYEIIITRTRNSLTTTPIVDEIQIAAETTHKWTKDGDINVASIALSDNTAYGVLCGGTSGTSAIQSIASVGTSGQILTSNGAGALPTMQAPVAATDVSDATFRIQDNGDISKEIAFEASSITTSTVRTITMPDVDLTLLDPTDVAITGGSITGTDIEAAQAPFYSNLDITYSSNTLTVTGLGGTALSATNIAYVGIPSTTGGQTKVIAITANQGFIDDTGSSEIIGNLFGMPTGVAYASDIPFYGYAVINDDQDAIAFMISRTPGMTTAPAVGEIGAPDDAVADEQFSFFSFDNIDEAVYDTNPCVQLFSFRMQMSASDDWTVQALGQTDGFGKLQQNVHFEVPLNKFGAGTSSHFLDNTGTAPIFNVSKYKYLLLADTGECIIFFNTTTISSAGVGSVTVRLLLPFTVDDYDTSSEVSLGGGYWDDSSLSKKNVIMCRTAASQLYALTAYVSDTAAERNMQNSYFQSNDTYNVILRYKIATS